MRLIFKDAKTEQPELNIEIMIKYMKGADGPFLIQGFLTDDAHNMGKYDDKKGGRNTTAWWRKQGYGLVYYDYARRQLESLTAKKSKNKVLEWAAMR